MSQQTKFHGEMQPYLLQMFNLCGMFYDQERWRYITKISPSGTETDVLWNNTIKTVLLWTLNISQSSITRWYTQNSSYDDTTSARFCIHERHPIPPPPPFPPPPPPPLTTSPPPPPPTTTTPPPPSKYTHGRAMGRDIPRVHCTDALAPCATQVIN